MKKMFIAALAVAAGIACAGHARAQSPAAARPQVVALVAAVGNQIEYVRQRQGTGSHLEPFGRKLVTIDSQALNFAVLRGLDQAIAEGEPDAQRVMLKWTPPPEVMKALEQAIPQKREEIVVESLRTHLRTLPERAQWDRIEAIVPSYFYPGMRGMATKLVGIGVFVQPLQGSKIDFDDNGEVNMQTLSAEQEGHNRTIDPNTGAHGRSSTYVAPYMYFNRLTIDARTLQVVATKRQFDNTKYADPNSTARDVGQQMPMEQLLGKLLETVERSAYKSVRGTNAEVTVTTPVEVPAKPASAPR